MGLLKEKIELQAEEAELLAQQALTSLPGWLKWVLLLLVFGLVPAYFATSSLSYHYWQNQLKPKALSAKPSFVLAQDLQMSQPVLIGYSDGSYAALVQIINPNTDLSADNLSFSWNYFNARGQQVAPTNSEAALSRTYILPGQKKYLVVPKILSAEPIASLKLQLKDKINWQKRLSLPAINLDVSPANLSLQTSPLALALNGTVYNNSVYKIRQIKLTFIIFDASGRPSAVSQRTENDLAPYERRAFKQLWPNLLVSNPSGQIFAETNLLDPNNLAVNQSQSGASDLSRPPNNNQFGF